jgi:hypothetical protein
MTEEESQKRTAGTIQKTSRELRGLTRISEEKDRSDRLRLGSAESTAAVAPESE